MTTANDLERAMLDLINAERQAFGLDPLMLERQLNTAAEDHSDWMLDTNRFSHTGIGGSSAGDRVLAAGFDLTGSWSWGENIAYAGSGGQPGYLDEVTLLHDALMDSPGHRANILSEGFDYIGIGIEIGNFNGAQTVMITQNFARTDAPVMADTGAGTQDPGAGTPPDTGADNSAPVLTGGAVTLSKQRDHRKADVADLITVSDADGDAIVYYELRDTAGRDNFVLTGSGRLDASTPYRLAADQLDDLKLRFNAPGTVTEVEIRAFDGQAYSEWAQIEITSYKKIKPPAQPQDTGTGDGAGNGTGGGAPAGPNTAPVLVAQDVTLSKTPGNRQAKLTDLITVDDAEGDEIVFYELRDTEGRDNFVRKGRKLDASEPFQIEAEKFDQLRVRHNREDTVTEVEIRAFDGTDYSDWVQIEITTLASGDLIA